MIRGKRNAGRPRCCVRRNCKSELWQAASCATAAACLLFVSGCMGPVSLSYEPHTHHHYPPGETAGELDSSADVVIVEAEE